MARCPRCDNRIDLQDLMKLFGQSKYLACGKCGVYFSLSLLSVIFLTAGAALFCLALWRILDSKMIDMTLLRNFFSIWDKTNSRQYPEGTIIIVFFLLFGYPFMLIWEHLATLKIKEGERPKNLLAPLPIILVISLLAMFIYFLVNKS